MTSESVCCECGAPATQYIETALRFIDFCDKCFAAEKVIIESWNKAISIVMASIKAEKPILSLLETETKLQELASKHNMNDLFNNYKESFKHAVDDRNKFQKERDEALLEIAELKAEKNNG